MKIYLVLSTGFSNPSYKTLCEPLISLSRKKLTPNFSFMFSSINHSKAVPIFFTLDVLSSLPVYPLLVFLLFP